MEEIKTKVAQKSLKKKGFLPSLVTLKCALGNGFSKAFAQNSCLCCGKESYGVSLCTSCAQKRLFSFLEPGKTRCEKCGKPLLSENGVCMACRENCIVSHCESVFPVHTYRLWQKRVLFAWKMQGERLFTPLFAKVLYEALCKTSLLEGLEKKESVLVGVPPRPGKIREKGWDQIDDLCKTLHVLYDFPVLKLLERKSREQQKKKDRAGRLQNKTLCYTLCKNYKKTLLHWARRNGFSDKTVPTSVILIDDVITTGATVDACAAILKEAGIKKVHVLSLFMVD